MKRIFIIELFIFSCLLIHANEVQEKLNLQQDFSVKNSFQEEYKLLKKTNTSLNMIFAGCLFLEHSVIQIPIISLTLLLVMRGGGIASFIILFLPIIAFIDFLTAGLILTPLGSVKYQKHKTKFSPIEEIYILLKHQQKMKYIAMVSGIINATGATIGGAGAGMICAAVLDGDKSELFTGGIVCAVVGGIALAVCLPLMITSLAMYGWCRGEINRLGVDFAVVPDDSCSNKQTLPNWKNCKLSLACNVQF